MVLEFSLDKTRNVGKKKLVIRKIHYFWFLKVCAKHQYIPIVLSKVIVVAPSADRQTPSLNLFFFFSVSGGLKMWRFHGIRESQFSYKTNTFSDENVKILTFGKIN